jgi:hypothetical protein
MESYSRQDIPYLIRRFLSCLKEVGRTHTSHQRCLEDRFICLLPQNSQDISLLRKIGVFLDFKELTIFSL